MPILSLRLRNLAFERRNLFLKETKLLHPIERSNCHWHFFLCGFKSDKEMGHVIEWNVDSYYKMKMEVLLLSECSKSQHQRTEATQL